jgi:hypothetical protein
MGFIDELKELFNKATKKEPEVKCTETSDGRRIFHVDLGNCPSDKAEAFIEYMKEKMKDSKCCGNNVFGKPEGCCNANLEEELDDICREEDEKCCKEESYFLSKGTDDLKQLLVFYIDLGTMPTFNGRAYVQELVGRYKSISERLPANVGIMFVPVRNSDTRIEMFNLGV